MTTVTVPTQGRHARPDATPDAIRPPHHRALDLGVAIATRAGLTVGDQHIENRTARVEVEHHPEWVDQVTAAARALGCLPTSHYDGHTDVVRAVRGVQVVEVWALDYSEWADEPDPDLDLDR